MGCKHSDPRSCHVADYKASATPCNQQYRMFAPAESGCAWSERSVADAYWAAGVADLGIGAAHDGPTPTTESLSAALRMTLTPETRARATAVAGTIRTDGRRWPRRFCSTRSAEEGRQRPREPRGIVGPGKAPGAGLHRQLGMLEETSMLGGVPRLQPGVVLIGEQQHRLPRSSC